MFSIYITSIFRSFVFKYKWDSHVVINISNDYQLLTVKI